MDGRSYLKHDGLVVFSWDLFPPPGNSGKSKLSIQIPEAKNVIKAGGDWDFGWRGWIQGLVIRILSNMTLLGN